VSAIVVAYFGSRLARVADHLADVTGLGEAIAGAVLLGGATSLPGIVTSVAAAHEGLPELSVSNALGGIAGQTVFLAMADISYRRANLEHAAASAANMMQGALLISLLAIAMVASLAAEVSFWGVHPATPILILVYLHGMYMVRLTHRQPMWQPEMTGETRPDLPEEEAAGGTRLRSLIVTFGLLTLIVALAGYGVYRSAVAIVATTGASQTVIGMLLTALATSMPELVTSLSAVRHGALTLAVSGILGGNAFDTLFLGFSDVAYREGSIYHAVSDQQLLLIGITILMNSTLLTGFLRREEHGVANIGFESFAVVVLYFLGAILIVVAS
jgi:cation:H+ antiporter